MFLNKNSRFEADDSRPTGSKFVGSLVRDLGRSCLTGLEGIGFRVLVCGLWGLWA